MLMKPCFGLSLSPSVSLLSRVILVGSALGFATACAHRDTAKTDSTTVASADSATTSTSSAAAAQPSTPVESVSTGETTVSAESKSNPAVAATAVTTGAAKVGTKATAPAAASTPQKVHGAAHNASSATPATTASAPAAAAATPTATDTGEKAPATDTSKKTASAAGGADHLLVSPQEYEGWKMFSVYCYRCHGVDAMGGGIAPNLRHSVGPEGSVTHDIFITTVTYGRTALGMPTWKALLSPEQMEDLWLYVSARSTNRLYPGRPHMAAGANP
jgi:mono/diheme cytochrome c family protein